MADIFGYDDTEWGYRFRFNGKEHRPTWEASELELDVPADIFAPEPPEWEKQWVNHYFTTKVVDQCEYRRRRIFAYTIQFPLVFVVQVFRLLITMLSALFALRGTTLMPFLNPLSMTTSQAVHQLDSESLLRHFDTSGDNKVVAFVKKYLLVLFTPIIFIPVLLMFLFVPIASIGIGFTVLAAFALAAALIIGIIVLCTSREAREKFMALFDGPKPWDEESNIKLLTCSKDGALTFDTLPSEKKTLKLRFQDVKSKVCRPFAR